MASHVMTEHSGTTMYGARVVGDDISPMRRTLDGGKDFAKPRRPDITRDQTTCCRRQTGNEDVSKAENRMLGVDQPDSTAVGTGVLQGGWPFQTPSQWRHSVYADPEMYAAPSQIAAVVESMLLPQMSLQGRIA